MRPASELDPQSRYNRFNTMQLNVRLNKHTDTDIIDALDKVSSKQGYIKALIRADIANRKHGENVKREKER